MAAGAAVAGEVILVDLAVPAAHTGWLKLLEALGVTCAGGSCGNKVQEINTGTNVVYRYVENGVTRYIGITNDFLRRAGEHDYQRGWQIERIPGLDHLSRGDAKAVEQVLIQIYGLTNLHNRINSIAATNSIYQQSVQRGTHILKTIDFLTNWSFLP